MQIYFFNSYEFTTSYRDDKKNLLHEINEYSFLSYL